MPLASSPEQPLPVRTVSRSIGEWIGRLGRVWVEGQVTQVTRRPGQQTCFIVLRDTAAEMSLPVSCKRSLLDSLTPPLGEGARVVVWAQPQFYPVRGSLTFTAHEIRPVGVGALLARIEQLRSVLAAEGLFAAERKRPLPFLPRSVGLVTGRASAAERDVVDNARRRWPAVEVRVEPVAVQGPYAVTEIVAALQRLDADPQVDVIVLARGGGSMEDLLPFSDESLVRAVVASRTPVVSAVGHETDVPLVDHAADVRASTPTDAAKLVVPDVAEESARILMPARPRPPPRRGTARERAAPARRATQPAGPRRPGRGARQLGRPRSRLLANAGAGRHWRAWPRRKPPWLGSRRG